MFPQKFSALSNEKRYLHRDLPRDVLHPELCSPRKGACADCFPLSPVPCPCCRGAEGALLSCTARSTSTHPGAGLLPDIPHKSSRTRLHHQFLFLAPLMTFFFVILSLLRALWRTGPLPAPLRVLEFKYLLLGTLCHGLLFTAIKLH